MATIRTEQINLSNWVSYLAGLDNRIVAGTDAVTIDGRVTLDLPLRNDTYDRRYMRITVNNVQHQTGEWYSGMTTPYVQTIIDNNFIIIRFTPSNYTPPFGGLEFIYVNDGAGHYYAGVNFATDKAFNIYDTALYYTAEGSTQYHLLKLIQFAADAGKIAYYPDLQTPIVNAAGALCGMAKGIVSCSSIAYNSSVAMPNGKNYYSIATNAMVEITAAANNE